MSKSVLKVRTNELRGSKTGTIPTLLQPRPFTDFKNRVFCMDALKFAKRLPSRSLHCVITSPPYWNLRDYNADGQIGMEDSFELYIQRLVELFREYRRVLRDDGVFWLNLGDSYSGRGKGPTGHNGIGNQEQRQGFHSPQKQNWGLPSKNLIGIPFRVAFALQTDGWILRSAVPWIKGNAMPESMTDRFTTAHEYWFLFTKVPKYYFDIDAVRIPHKEVSKKRAMRGRSENGKYVSGEHLPNKNANTLNQPREHLGYEDMEEMIASGDTSLSPLGRNFRTTDLWNNTLEWWREHLNHIHDNGGLLLDCDGETPLAFHINPSGYKGAHFATFPPKLIEPIVLSSCPEKVCSCCGAPYIRVVEKERAYDHVTTQAGKTKTGPYAAQTGDGAGTHDIRHGVYSIRHSKGFTPSCECDAEPIGGIVCDPFWGAGTTAVVAEKLNRRWTGSELNPEYVKLGKKRLMQGLPLFSMLERS